MDLPTFRSALDEWLEQHARQLAPTYEGSGTLDERVAHLAHVKQLAYEAGWMRWGWPEEVGGLGGSPILRAYLGEALMAREVVEPDAYSMTEVLAPTMIHFAAPALAAEMVPRLLRGDEIWCQGFSEPGTGSNLASLACRAVRTDDGWRVTGQKVWTSYAQYAARCVLLTRTGSPESAHRGITAKSLAGRGAAAAARHSQQVLAGLGFTAEHPFHRSYRRVLLLDQLFGSAHTLTDELGDELLRSRQLPVLLPL